MTYDYQCALCLRHGADHTTPDGRRIHRHCGLAEWERECEQINREIARRK